MQERQQSDKSMIIQSIKKFLVLALFCIIVMQDTCLADDMIAFNLTPSIVYRENTATFRVDLIPIKDLKDTEIEFYVDASKIGAKELPKLEGNRSNWITFDHYFDANSYIGEHYIELRINTSSDNVSFYRGNFLTSVGLSDKSRPYFIFLLVDLAFLVISFFEINKKKNESKFSPEIRKILFALLITVLPIGTSFFISIINNPILKIDLILILICFAISYIISIYGFTRYEGHSGPDADNFTLYSLVFLFLGLINMLVSVILSSAL